MEMWADHTARPQFSAVARDTGFPAAIAAVMHGRGEIPGMGVQAPENVVPPKPFFGELKKRGFTFRRWNLQLSLGQSRVNLRAVRRPQYQHLEEVMHEGLRTGN